MVGEENENRMERKINLKGRGWYNWIIKEEEEEEEEEEERKKERKTKKKMKSSVKLNKMAVSK